MIFENIKLALASLRANKMRSFLTMLGMIIGISSVIAIVSLGDTLRGAFAKEYENVGMGLAFLWINPEDGYYTEKELFTKDEADRIKEALGDDLTYVGFQSGERTDMIAGRKRQKLYLSGLSENPTAVKNPQIMYGRMLNDRDIQEKKKYAVIENGTAMELFGTENVVGKTVQVTINQEQEELMIVGVYANTDSALMKLMGGGGPGDAYVPESIMISEDTMNFQLYFYMNEEADMNKTMERVKNLVVRMKGCEYDSIKASSALEEMGSVDSLLSSLSMVVGAIAAISLLVGGIGIMNIMLVSVTERTREIGIRKALGARMKDILIQFLIEAAAISAAGGIIGTALGVSVVSIAGMAVGLGAVVKPSVVGLAVAFSAVVGLGFGLYPARKAARKDPVEALRYE